MYFLSLFIHVYLILHCLISPKGYVLFAANVEDFQRIAKKLGSDKFMDQLSELASEPLAKFTPKTVRNDKIKTRFQTREREIPIARQREPALSLRLKGESRIDFEELVERVKQRLEKEFINKYKSQARDDKQVTTPLNRISTQRQRFKTLKNKQNLALMSIITTTMATTSQDYDEDVEKNNEEAIPTQMEPKEIIGADATYESGFSKQDVHKNSQVYFDNVYDYNVQNNSNVKDELLYEKVVLKDDAYEDYEIPQKESNIYVTNENTRYKKIDNRLKTTTDTAQTVDNIEYVDDATIGSREIKARTERLWYDDNANDTRIISDERSQGTGVPTRHTYKIITPNYYASLPTVAEKYDFNEPIPEKDRERERIKYIGNPHARINKKIKLLK